MAACVAALVLIVAASLALGVRAIDVAPVWQALTSPDVADADHDVVLHHRVPRTVVGLCRDAPSASPARSSRASRATPSPTPACSA